MEAALGPSTCFFISSDSARFIPFFSVFDRLMSDVSLSPSSDLDYFLAGDSSTNGAILISLWASFAQFPIADADRIGDYDSLFRFFLAGVFGGTVVGYNQLLFCCPISFEFVLFELPVVVVADVTACF